MTFKDHFSVARGYGRYRPGYPSELFDYLAAVAPNRGLAWDCGTGSGQAARGLAGRFREVVATDPSLRQLGRAHGEGIRFAAGRAERAPLAGGVVDLVTVGQALHWFDFDRFYAEVRRVAAPRAAIVAWTYGFFSAGPEVDAIIRTFAGETVGPYWPPERAHVDSTYAGLPFPFPRLAAPRPEMREVWSFDDLFGYLGTWSSVNRYRRHRGEDPLPALVQELIGPWGGATRSRAISWELTLLAGRVES